MRINRWEVEKGGSYKVMLNEIFKDKKRIGILSILAIILIVSGLTYIKSGFKELKKNDNESIFVDAEIDNNLVKEKSSDGNDVNKESAVQLKDKKIVVEIKGEVNKPDVYILDEESIVKDLIDMAGGLREEADLSKINRAKKLQNHELVYISNVNDNVINGTINSEVNSTANQVSSNGKININYATLEQLKELNGIGDAKAKKIIEYREKNGGFKSLEDMKNVDGIGEKMFEKIKEQIEI